MVSASNRSLKGLRWIVEVENPAFSYDALADPGKSWEILTISCPHSSVVNWAGKCCGRRMRIEWPGRGRFEDVRCFVSFYEYFETKQSLSQVYGITDLLKVTLQNESFEAFLNS